MVARLLLIACGGACGSVARYLLSGLVHRTGSLQFPWGTFIVNVAGCFAIGLVAGLSEERLASGPNARLFLLVGFLGGFTTFSTFGWETFELFRRAEIARALANATGQVGLGLAALWVGWLASRLWRAAA